MAQSVEKVNFHAGVYRFALHQSLPCVKGGGSAQADSEGLCAEMLRIRITFRRNCYILLHQSLSHAVRVTAPFTQGSLRRSRARGFIDTLRGSRTFCFLLNFISDNCRGVVSGHPPKGVGQHTNQNHVTAPGCIPGYSVSTISCFSSLRRIRKRRMANRPPIQAIQARLLQGSS